MNNKKWTITFLVCFFVLLVGLGGLTAVVDPFFHYHKPLKSLQYQLSDARYINDGIVKHFDYDAIIAGTSMTQNFKSSEFDVLFQVQSAKVPFSGAGFKEINDNLERALKANPKVKLVLRGLDYRNILRAANWQYYEPDQYPEYLYDDRFYNDVKYLLNKSVLFEKTLFIFDYTKDGNKTTTFDQYGNWMEGQTFGKDAVLATYDWAVEVSETTVPFTEKDRQIVYDNITQNVTSLAERYPDVEFYFFFTPYSICYFHTLCQDGGLERQLEVEKYTIELLLPYENIHLFSFFTEFDMITNLDNYKDARHYSEDVNSQILHWMKDGYGELTIENYEGYCAQVREFFANYDYGVLSMG